MTARIKVPGMRDHIGLQTKTETSKMKLTPVGIDIAKNVFVRPESRVSYCFTGEGMA
jgi:hypothetical protein